MLVGAANEMRAFELNPELWLVAALPQGTLSSRTQRAMRQRAQ